MRVADAEPALLWRVDKEQATKGPEGLPAQPGLGLLLEQNDAATRIGEFRGRDQPGKACPHHNHVSVSHSFRDYAAKLLLVETPNPHPNAVPVVREAVRAVVLDRDNRVLLFKAFRDDRRSQHFWITPGGGVTAGESAPNALRRELAEECGLAYTLGPLIWVREHVFALPGSGQLIRQGERFYLVRVDQHDVDVTGWDEFERTFLGEHRWWTIGEIEVSGDEFAPRRLAHFLAAVVDGYLPSEPVDTGI